MKQIELEEYICTPPVWHGKFGHFQAGEKRCRRCEIFYKPTFKENVCPICHYQLTSKSRRWKYEDDVE